MNVLEEDHHSFKFRAIFASSDSGDAYEVLLECVENKVGCQLSTAGYGDELISVKLGNYVLQKEPRKYTSIFKIQCC